MYTEGLPMENKLISERLRLVDVVRNQAFCRFNVSGREATTTHNDVQVDNFHGVNINWNR